MSKGADSVRLCERVPNRSEGSSASPGAGDRQAATLPDAHMAMSADRAADSRPVDLVHIVAPSHSGSTLVTLLLARHPEITTVGELKSNLVGDLHTYRCSCGDLITRCAYWKRVSQGMAERGHDFDITGDTLHFRLPGRRIVDRLARLDHGGKWFEHLRDFALNCSPAWRAHHKRVRSESASLIRVVAQLNGARFFVDSSKHAVRLKYLKSLESIPVKAIHLIRDGRGTSHTYITQRDYSMELAAREWKRGHLSGENALARLAPEQKLRIYYEDLCRDPETTLGKVLRFLGIDSPASDLLRNEAEHHVIGNSMRLSFNGEIKLDDRWRREFSAEQLDVFDRVAGDLNRKYGYT